MKFIYLGQCNIIQHEIETFLATGKDLKVKWSDGRCPY